MALPTDLSLMDILFDRDDPVLKIMDDKEIFKTTPFSDKLENWTSDDDMITDIFSNNELMPFHGELMDTNGVWDSTEVKSEPVALSDSYSDSGYSNGQLSPGLPADFEFSPRRDDDGDLSSSTVSITSDSSLNHHQIEDGEITQTEPPRKKIRQVMKVSPMLGSNPRSVLLPVNNGSGLRTYKIVSPPGGLKTIKPLAPGTQVVIKSVRPNSMPVIARTGRQVTAVKRVRSHVKPMESPSHDSDDEINVVSEDEESRIYEKQHYPRLMLSPEERKLMQKEGVVLPTHYPLTKLEERELKRIRRKIRNKISAQDSRKRKKEYLDGLEDRVRQCTEENMSLVRKIKYLQSHNQSLMAQLKKLQALLAGNRKAKSAQPATCLLVLILSVALVMAPNLRLTTPNDAEIAEQEGALSEKAHSPMAGRTRSLLSSEMAVEDELLCLGSEQEIPAELHEMLKFHGSDADVSESSDSRKSSISWADAPHFLADHDYGPAPTKRRLFHLEEKLAGIQVDDVWPPRKIEEIHRAKQLIIPDVDDEWLPASSGLVDGSDGITTEVKVNISDGMGTRTLVIQVPKEQK